MQTFFGAKNNKIKDNITQDLANNKNNLTNRGANNDIILKNDETIGRSHFRIRFDPVKNSYFMKDMGDGSGTFMRIE